MAEATNTTTVPAENVATPPQENAGDKGFSSHSIIQNALNQGVIDEEQRTEEVAEQVKADKIQQEADVEATMQFASAAEAAQYFVEKGRMTPEEAAKILGEGHHPAEKVQSEKITSDALTSRYEKYGKKEDVATEETDVTTNKSETIDNAETNTESEQPEKTSDKSEDSSHLKKLLQQSIGSLQEYKDQNDILESKVKSKDVSLQNLKNDLIKANEELDRIKLSNGAPKYSNAHLRKMYSHVEKLNEVDLSGDTETYTNQLLDFVDDILGIVSNQFNQPYDGTYDNTAYRKMVGSLANSKKLASDGIKQYTISQDIKKQPQLTKEQIAHREIQKYL